MARRAIPLLLALTCPGALARAAPSLPDQRAWNQDVSATRG